MSATGGFGNIAVEFDGAVGVITLNRPDKLNAFTQAMVDELVEALRLVSGTEAVRCILLTGAGRAFCAGADTAVLSDLARSQDREAGTRLVDGARAVHRLIRRAPQPVLCALNGVAAGGGANLALGCDLRIAADTAKIGQVFARIGLHPDWGGSWFLPRLIGPSRAFELFVSAEMVDAERMLAWGMVNRVVPAADLAQAARTWARQIALAPPLSVQRLKQNLYQSERATLEEMLDRELEAQLDLFRTEDFREGLTAFLEKRSPHFTGR